MMLRIDYILIVIIYITIIAFSLTLSNFLFITSYLPYKQKLIGVKKIFNIVANARDEAFKLVQTRFKEEKEIRGYEVDDVSRNIIRDAGYGDYFIHRTGHSITTDLHGSGAHMDDFETKDERLLFPSTSFSIEPGIYLTGDFGVRSEIDVYISPDKEVIATGGERQREVFAIL